MARLLRRRPPTHPDTSEREHRSVTRGPTHQFVTLDPHLRLDRRRDTARRERVQAILDSLSGDAEREAYLLRVRRTTSIRSRG